MIIHFDSKGVRAFICFVSFVEDVPTKRVEPEGDLGFQAREVNRVTDVNSIIYGLFVKL